MTESSEASGDQVLVECSSLPPPLRNDLQALLERQPGVRAVTRMPRVGEALPNPDTVGLVVPGFDLVVHLAECPQPRAAEAMDNTAEHILKTVAEWWKANRPREAPAGEFPPGAPVLPGF